MSVLSWRTQVFLRAAWDWSVWQVVCLAIQRLADGTWKHPRGNSNVVYWQAKRRHQLGRLEMGCSEVPADSRNSVQNVSRYMVWRTSREEHRALSSAACYLVGEDVVSSFADLDAKVRSSSMGSRGSERRGGNGHLAGLVDRHVARCDKVLIVCNLVCNIRCRD